MSKSSLFDWDPNNFPILPNLDSNLSDYKLNSVTKMYLDILIKFDIR